MRALQRLFPSAAPPVAPLSIYDDLEFPAGRDGRPYVALNMVTTVDGKATLDRGRYRKEPIGSRVDRSLMQQIRSAADAVLRGAGTVRANPYFPGVGEELEGVRQRRGLARQPLAVVVTGSGDLPLDSPFFARAPRRPVVLTARAADPDRLQAAGAVADVEVVGDRSVDLVAALRLLRKKYGVGSLLSEGGPTLNYEFLRHDLLDELFWTVAPKVGGMGEDLTMVDGPELLLPLPALTLVTAFAHQDELFLRYRVPRGA